MSRTPVTAIGKYQVVDLIGEGAMGAVYRALDPVLNRMVAIKVMSDAIARDDALRDRFMREAQAAGSLQHPNVVTIYDFGEFEGHLFIAMELVEGNDLEQLIEKRVPLTLDQRLGIVIDVLVGLSYAHRRGVVHRDIKPGNIRITEDGRAKIMDFGVAHLESTKMTATGVMIGTPNYMAPEQVTGQKVGPPTDIFAVGAVLYELLSHHKAFGGDSLHSVLFKVVSEEPPSLRLVAPDIPVSLDPIVQKALAKEPEDRYQSAQEMANALAEVRSKLAGARSASLSLAATIASHTGEHAARAAIAKQRRRRRAVLGGVAGVLLLAGGSGAAVWLAWRDRETPAPGVEIAGLTPKLPLDTATPAAAAPDSTPAGPQRAPAEPQTSARDAAPASRSESRPNTSPPPQPEPPRRDAVEADSMYRVALQAQRLAVAAGATPASLTRGDSLLAEGERLRRSNQFTAAAVRLTLAVNAFTEAQRTAERAAASNAGPISTRGAPADSAVQRPVPQLPPATPITKAPAGGASTSVAAPPTTRSDPEVPFEQAIASLIAEYARAIEARDLNAIRRVYPTITDDQLNGFRQFFQAVRELKARLTASNATSSGATGAAVVTGEYTWIDTSGRNQRRPVSFTATFRREGTRWEIVATESR